MIFCLEYTAIWANVLSNKVKVKLYEIVYGVSYEYVMRPSHDPN